jgi:hypothetical protein
MKLKTVASLFVLTVLTAISHQLSAVYAQGSLTPPAGAPAPVMKSLDQIEARTPISTSPIIINKPGSYYLTTNLSPSVTIYAPYAIDIATNGVTLDLNGFSIRSISNVANSCGIYIRGGVRNIQIQNGFIEGGVTNDGSGTFSNNGFDYAINYDFFSLIAPHNLSVRGVAISGCSYGISLPPSESTAVTTCMVRTASGVGIYAGTIQNCVALDCRLNALTGIQIMDSRGVSLLSPGISATRLAINCYGESSSGTAVVSTNAAFCTASRVGGRAIQAIVANGCFALNGTNLIAYKYNMP